MMLLQSLQEQTGNIMIRLEDKFKNPSHYIVYQLYANELHLHHLNAYDGRTIECRGFLRPIDKRLERYVTLTVEKSNQIPTDLSSVDRNYLSKAYFCRGMRS